MKRKHGYQVVPFSIQRQAVAASATVGRERNNIHTFTEVDITTPRRWIREHRQHTGEHLSLTAYVVACLTRTITEYPIFNAFRTGRKLVLLDNVTVGVLVERTIAGEGVPEILTIHAADTKTYRQINDEIRAAQQQGDVPFGSLSGSTWIMRLIPGFLLTQFIRLAARNIRLTRFRCHLMENLAREKNYFLSFLFLSFSSFGQVSPFGDPFGTTSCAVLEDFTTEELSRQSLDELVAYLQQHGRGRFADPEALAATLQRAARDAYRLDKVLDEPLRVVFSLCLPLTTALSGIMGKRRAQEKYIGNCLNYDNE